jgi:thiol-disulfide isomerase/thioredoxin
VNLIYDKRRGVNLLSAKRKFLCVSVLVMSLSVIAAAPYAAHAEKRTLQDQCVVLFEKVTGTWCPPCGTVSPTVDQVWDDYGATKVAIVEYHNGQFANPGASYYDPFASDATNTKAGDLGVTGVPTVFIDGKTKLVGVQDYATYQTEIDSRLGIVRDFTITVAGDVTSGSVDVTLDQLGSSSATNTVLRYAVVESDKYFSGGTDPDNTYHHICRAIPTEDAITLPLSGPATFTKTYTVDGGWDSGKLSFVAFLQSTSGDKEVYQAIFYGYGAPAVPEFNAMFMLPVGGALVAIIAVAMTGKGKDE